MKLALVLLYCFLDFTDWGLTKKEKLWEKYSVVLIASNDFNSSSVI